MSERFTHKLLHPDKVSDLMVLHSAKVAELLAKARSHVSEHPDLAEAAKRAPLDDLFVLRFILSERDKEADSAYKNLIATLEWRAARLEALDGAAQGKGANFDTITQHMHAGVIGYLGGIHPVLLVRVGRSHPKRVFAELTPEQIIEANLLKTEQVFRMCDAKTRETGFLCKQIAIIDLEGFSLLNFDPRISRMVGKSSTLSAIYYPQLLGKKVIVNMPTAFRMMYKMMATFMPASTLEKQTICPANTLKGSAADCPFLKRFANGTELMPPFLGGTGSIPPELVIKPS